MSKSQKSLIILDGALTLFSQKGFFATTIPDIAKFLGMSAGNLYNYFSSKEELAKEIVRFCADYLADKIQAINEDPSDSKEKIEQMVGVYFDMVKEKPEHINYFLKVYLANEEIFSSVQKELLFDSRLIKQLRIMFEDGVLRGELRNQDFFSVFGLMMGNLGGISFMYMQGLLENDISWYKQSVSENIYEALRVKSF